MFISSTGDIENMIGCPGGYSRVEQPLPLLLPGCEKNADDIFDIELPSTIQQHKSQKIVGTKALPPSRQRPIRDHIASIDDSIYSNIYAIVASWS